LGAKSAAARAGSRRSFELAMTASASSEEKCSVSLAVTALPMRLSRWATVAEPAKASSAVVNSSEARVSSIQGRRRCLEPM